MTSRRHAKEMKQARLDIYNGGKSRKLKIPPKIRIFLVESSAEFSPKKTELKRRHVAKESHCEACGDREESIFHVAVSCTMARRFWQEIKLVMGCKLPSLHPSTWARDLLSGQSCSFEEAALFICGPGLCGQVAMLESMEEITLIQEQFRHTLLKWWRMLYQTPQPKSKWSKPGSGWRKINTTASFVASSCSGSGGVVIRDDSGKVVAAASRHYDHVPDVLTAEALAARDGVLLAQASGFETVILEVDCLTLVNLLRSVDGGRSPIAGIWHEIRELSSDFLCFDISFVNRESNKTAHLCAKLALSSSSECVWKESFPLGLEGITLLLINISRD
jgi:hypothetical protein